MNEFQIKQEIASCLKYADIFGAFTTLSMLLTVVVFFITAGLFFYRLHLIEEQRASVTDERVVGASKIIKLGIGAIIVGILATSVFPSKGSKIAEAEAYISQLPPTPQNKAFIYSLGKRYDIATSDTIEATLKKEAIEEYKKSLETQTTAVQETPSNTVDCQEILKKEDGTNVCVKK